MLATIRMDLSRRIVLIQAPLGPDLEAKRWYAEGGESCLVLSEGGKLLEPIPTFGPTCYSLIATNVDEREASKYASAHGFRHVRTPPKTA